MIDVALVCDYSMPSVAYDACVFADVLAEAGFRPCVISSGKIQRGVSRYWDQRVARGSFYRRLREVREVVFLNHVNNPSELRAVDCLAVELATILDVPLSFAGWDIETEGRYSGSNESMLGRYIEDNYAAWLNGGQESKEGVWVIGLRSMWEQLRLFGLDSRSVTSGISVRSSRQFTVDYRHCDVVRPKIAVLLTSSSSQDAFDNGYVTDAVYALLSEGADFTIFSRKMGWLPSAVKQVVAAGRCKYRAYEYLDDIPLLLHGFCGCIMVSRNVPRGCMVAASSRVPTIAFASSGFQRLLLGTFTEHFSGKIE